MSSARVAQRRQRDRQHVQPVEQVLAELSRACTSSSQVPVGRRDHADVDADVGRAADALERLLLEKAQQLGLQRRHHLADLVEEHRAAVGRSRAGRASAGRASVNAPRSWPNSSLSSSASGSAEQVMFMNGLAARSLL